MKILAYTDEKNDLVYIEEVNIPDLFPPEWPSRPVSVEEAKSWGKANLSTAITYWKNLKDENDTFLPLVNIIDKPEIIDRYNVFWERVKMSNSFTTVAYSYSNKTDVCKRCPYSDYKYYSNNRFCRFKESDMVIAQEFYKTCALVLDQGDEVNLAYDFMKGKTLPYKLRAQKIEAIIASLTNINKNAQKNLPVLNFCRASQYFLRQQKVVWWSGALAQFISGEVEDTFFTVKNGQSFQIVSFVLDRPITLGGVCGSKHTVRVTDPRLMLTVNYLSMLNNTEYSKKYAEIAEMQCSSFCKQKFIDAIQKDSVHRGQITKQFYSECKSKQSRRVAPKE